MDATLVTVTVLSMSMAAALSAIVWRMLRLERQRSNARVAALAAAATRVADDLPIRAPLNDHPVAVAPMFAERAGESPWTARIGVMVAVALVIASTVLFSLAARARGTRHASAMASTTSLGQVNPAANAVSGQLELLALRDARQPGSLTITGLVQNPRAGATLSRVAVTAYAFDDHGSMLASGRALIDITSLGPGEESPFTVTVPVTDAVARYRIGFHDDSGRVIGHVDRRQSGPMASNW